jgi:response regulator NasT
MESALIISTTEKNASVFTGLLNAASIKQIAFLPSCSEARRLLTELDFDLVVVNAPLRDESGEAFSRDIASKGASQVILAVKNDFFEEISAACENDGVLTISKPVDRALFWSALTLAKSTHSKIQRLLAEKNVQLQQQIEDIRIINRAKWLLISYMNMNEKDAHRFIEKQAMDMRTTKRVIAEGILKKYEN